MAKRFTDTEKWKNPWYRKLPSTYRDLWNYMLDMCDNAGVWRVDLEMASMVLNSGELSESVALHVFGDRIDVIDHDKWLIKDFIEFQFGELRDQSPIHQSIIKLLAKHGIHDFHKTGLSETPHAIAARLSKKKKLQVLANDYYRCTYCSLPGDDRTLVVDHIIPRTKGGNNDDFNLTSACVSCNSRKNDIMPEEFIARHKLSDTLSESLKAKLTTLNTLFNKLNTLKEKEEEKEEVKAKDKDQEKENAREKIILDPLKINSPQEIVDLWHEHCPKLSSIKKLTQTRKDKIRVRIAAEPLKAYWENLFKKIPTVPFLIGETDRGTWKVDLDWILENDTNAVKIIEGKYDSIPRKSAANNSANKKQSAPDTERSESLEALFGGVS